MACFAFGQSYPVVDVNVMRVLSRFVGQTAATDYRRARELCDFAWRILPEDRVREHNHGLLDFSAQVCKPRRPDCEACPPSTNYATGVKRLSLAGAE